MLRRLVGSLTVLSIVGLSGCGSKTALTVPSQVSINISLPASTTLLPGQSAQFSASVSNATNTNVIWEVNNIENGNAEFGTITSSGLYTAPTTLPVSAIRRSASSPTSTTVTITASASANTSASASATVTLIVAPTVTVSPTTATVYGGASAQFTASVANSSNTSVNWQVNGIAGGNATVGTITSTGAYTAPTSVTSTTSVTVTAVSAVYSGSSASATVTLKPAPVITLSPNSPSVMATKTVQLMAAVSDGSAVTWEVNGVQGGSTSIGMISATGLYTAPSAVPSPAAVTVSAVSVEDPSVQASEMVTVTPLLQIVLTVTPSNNVQPLGQLNLSASSTIANDTLVWKVNTTVNGDTTLGTITVTGATTALYQAPDPAPSAGFVTVYAYSTLYPTVFGSATITIGTQPPGITINQGNQNVVIADTFPFTATVTPSNLSQAVTWSVQGIVGGNANVGTICNTTSNPACPTPGLYTAPSIFPADQAPAGPNPVTITAASTAEPNTGSASVTITLPATVSVAVNPTNPPAPASLAEGESEALNATVTPANIPNVTWSLSTTTSGLTCNPNVSPNPCGGITSDPNHLDSGHVIFTAPTLPDALQSADIVVTATSVSDTTAQGSITITVTANPTITISPGTVVGVGQPETGVTVNLNGTQSFTATLAHVPPGTGVIWSLGCINADEDDNDECPNGQPWNASGGDKDGDGNGPGTINPLSGTNTLTVTYTGPATIFFSSFPSNVCAAANFNPTTPANSYAFAPLTATMSIGGTPATVCIQVNDHP